VVAIGKNPFFSILGTFISKIVITTKMPAITLKKVAVTLVHAIQLIFLFLYFN